MLLGQTSKFCSNKKYVYDRIYLKEEAAITRDTQGARHTEPRRHKTGTDSERHII